MPDGRQKRRHVPPKVDRIVSTEEYTPITDDIEETYVESVMLENFVYFNGVYIDPKQVRDMYILYGMYTNTIEINTTNVGTLRWEFEDGKTRNDDVKVAFKTIVNKVLADA